MEMTIRNEKSDSSTRFSVNPFFFLSKSKSTTHGLIRWKCHSSHASWCKAIENSSSTQLNQEFNKHHWNRRKKCRTMEVRGSLKSIFDISLTSGNRIQEPIAVSHSDLQETLLKYLMVRNNWRLFQAFTPLVGAFLIPFASKPPRMRPWEEGLKRPHAER